MPDERGNALFLILIAVALFAALSYAVTQSSRGGGAGVDSERQELDIAQMMQQVVSIRTHINRLYWMDEVDQVRFDSSAYNGAGTVYTGGGATTTGRTIGVFNPSEGIATLVHPLQNPGAPNTENFAMQFLQVRVNGTELGTSAADEILAVYDINDAACAAINEELTGSTAIPQWSTFGAGDNRSERLNTDGTFGVNNALKRKDIPLLPGCNKDPLSTWKVYFEVIRQN